MSETINKANQDLDALSERFKAEEEVKKKRVYVDSKKIDREFKAYKTAEEEQKIAESVRFGTVSYEQIEEMMAENDEYLEASKNPMRFICKTFDGVVPFFRKNIIVVGADTGRGKTTFMANAAFSIITKKSPVTGKLGRVLILTNEEAPPDIYNRITALAKGFAYTNHNEFTDEQRKMLKEGIKTLALGGRVNVIGDTYKDSNGNMLTGMTTTPEGIKSIFDNIIKNNDYYDAVIIDYYQNITASKDNLRLDPFQCQDKFSDYIDILKNNYPAPILLFAQMEPENDSTKPYNMRIRGRKKICTKATVFLEVESEVSNHRTKCIVRKGRYIKSLGKEFYIGFDRGHFVDYTKEFQANINKIKENEQARRIENQTGIKLIESEVEHGNNIKGSGDKQD